jgi:hypothetical protein
MQLQSRLGPTGTLLIHCFVVGGWLVIGIWTAFGPQPVYPAGDQRGGPFFWPTIGIATAALGLVILGYAIRDFRRRRRPPGAEAPAAPRDIAER